MCVNTWKPHYISQYVPNILMWTKEIEHDLEGSIGIMNIIMLWIWRTKKKANNALISSINPKMFPVCWNEK